MSGKPVPVDSKLAEPSERPKDTVCKSKEQPTTKMRIERSASEKMVERTKVIAEVARGREAQRMESPRDKIDFKLETFGAVLVREAQHAASAIKDKKQIPKSETPKSEVPGEKAVRGSRRMESSKDARDAMDVKSTSAKIPEEGSAEDTKDGTASKLKTIPILEKVSCFYSEEDKYIFLINIKVLYRRYILKDLK